MKCSYDLTERRTQLQTICGGCGAVAVLALLDQGLELSILVGSVGTVVFLSALTLIDGPLEKQTEIVGATILSIAFVAAAIWLQVQS